MPQLIINFPEERELTKRDIQKIFKLIGRKELLDVFNLTEREKLILELFWGKQFTLQQIGDEINLTRERVRQIYEKAIRRILHAIRIANKKYTILNQILDENKALVTENEFLKRKLKSISLRDYFNVMEGKFNEASEILPDEATRNFLNKLLDIPLTELDLSVRAINSLAKQNIKSVGQLIQFSSKEIKRFPLLGKTTLDEIKYELRSRGLKLKD
jgi:predicted DNA-binding protein YlxM (UPF0122 family)